MTTQDQKNSVEMQSALYSNTQDINTVLTSSGEVRPVFHGHYFQMGTKLFGIQGLITEILTERGASFPAGIENTELRQIAVASAMFTQDIIDEVIRRFTAGSIRYPEKTIRATLSVTMLKLKTVSRVKLTSAEDKKRICNKPRFKWYLVSK
jgi:hypothetical protein